MPSRIMTVKGPIQPQEMGVTLPHEHVMCDFIGADQTGPDRWKHDEVLGVMERYLRDVAELGVRTFVDCSPMYIGRDPLVLRSLSDLTGVHILTNTGMYKEPFLPSYAFEMEAEQLADGWIQEIEEGIETSGVRPGFIKTAVQPEPLATMQRKITTAAAIASAATGLSVATHTGVAAAAEEVLDIMEERGVDPGRWIFVHAQNEKDPEALLRVAQRGAWIELDGLSPASAETHLRHLEYLLDRGFEESILLSHDAGWYSVGEPKGGEVRPYTYLFSDFIPALEKRGIGGETITALTVTNPSRAFAVASGE